MSGHLEPIQTPEHWLIVFMHTREGQGCFILLWLCSFDGSLNRLTVNNSIGRSKIGQVMKLA